MCTVLPVPSTKFYDPVQVLAVFVHKIKPTPANLLMPNFEDIFTRFF